MITYADLKGGKILKPDDILILHGLRYRVSQNVYLAGQDCINNQIFDKLRIPDKLGFCAAFGKVTDGGFPFMESFEALTKAVIALYEMSPYKVGNKVVIMERKGRDIDYPYSFIDEMAEQKGKVYTIKRIITAPYITDRKYHNGDPHKYKLDDSTSYDWHSSMFRLAERSDMEIKEMEDTEKSSDEQFFAEMNIQLSTEIRKKTVTHIVL